MLKSLLFVALLGLLACTADPLEVRTESVDDTGVDDGLTPTELAKTEGWEETQGVLRATGPATLTLVNDHEAVTLALALRTAEDTRATLTLDGVHTIALPGLELAADSAELRNAVQLTPGVWHDLEIAYQPGTGAAPALLIAAYLDGTLVYYQEALPERRDSDGTLSLEVTAGTLEIADVRSAAGAGKTSRLASNGKVELHLPLIHYAYYDIEGNPDDVTDYDHRTPSKTGYIGRFDLPAVREQQSGYAVRFTSTLEVPKANTYTFTMFSPSSTRLYIDNELVIDLGGKGGEFEGQGSVELTEGSHAIRMDHYQYGGWNRLNFAYLDEDGEAQSLNDIPEDRPVVTPPAGAVEELATDDRPYLLRSFLNFPPSRVYDFTEKRTHVINVGEGGGPHYSYDLNTGSLLQVWRGGFVDVANMWVERGEPQTARPLGQVVAFDGRPQWSDTEGEWPTDAPDVRHLRYELDAAGRPTFYFAVDDREVSDQLRPEQNGLVRTLTNTDGSTTLYTQLASARSISELSPGSFELRGPGAKLEVTELAAGGLRLLQGPRGQRLVAELPAGEAISYRVDW